MSVTAVAACRYVPRPLEAPCTWSAAGTMAQVDRDAERHTAKTGHPTCTVIRPA